MNFNIYAEIDLTNEQDSQGSTSGGATGDAAEQQNSQNSQNQNRHPPVPHLPSNGRPSRPHSRLDDAELLLMQLADRQTSARSRPAPNSRSGGSPLINARPMRDLPARLQRLVQAHGSGSGSGSGSTRSGLGALSSSGSGSANPPSTPAPTPITLEQLHIHAAERNPPFILPPSLELDVDALPGILDLPLHEEHEQQQQVTPPPVSENATDPLSGPADAEATTPEPDGAGEESPGSTPRAPFIPARTPEEVELILSQLPRSGRASPAATGDTLAPTESSTGSGAAAATTTGATEATAAASGAEGGTTPPSGEAGQAAEAGGASGGSAAASTIADMSPEVRAALGDLEVPEGVDPSFLAALPSEMREEVIQEHLRMQRIRQRAQQNAIQIAHDSLVEVNPEFLAALPLNIQSEVLMQQRIEQQRQAAQSANPEDPVDTAAFFQNLPENLRQAVGCPPSTP